MSWFDLLAMQAVIFLGWSLWMIRQRRKHGIRLNALGRTYNVMRWEGESNEHFLERIRDRINITGGKLW